MSYVYTIIIECKKSVVNFCVKKVYLNILKPIHTHRRNLGGVRWTEAPPETQTLEFDHNYIILCS